MIYTAHRPGAGPLFKNRSCLLFSSGAAATSCWGWRRARQSPHHRQAEPGCWCWGTGPARPGYWCRGTGPGPTAMALSTDTWERVVGNGGLPFQLSQLSESQSQFFRFSSLCPPSLRRRSWILEQMREMFGCLILFYNTVIVRAILFFSNPTNFPVPLCNFHKLDTRISNLQKLKLMKFFKHSIQSLLKHI